MLRSIYPERWLRIHSLPESKRYAESEEEWAELLLRHNIVATETLDEGSPCYLIRGLWIEPDVYRQSWVADLEGHEQSLQFNVTETVWNRSRHNVLLREVADEKVANIVFASRVTGQVYAPYDGGADLVFCNGQERNERKQLYRAWLSAHPEGL